MLKVPARRPLECRCPACNPLHTSFARWGANNHAKAKKTTCMLCGGTRTVSVEVAGRYVGEMYQDDTEQDFDHPLFG